MTSIVIFHVATSLERVKLAVHMAGYAARFDANSLRQEGRIAVLDCHDPDDGNWAHNLLEALLQDFGDQVSLPREW